MFYIQKKNENDFVQYVKRTARLSQLLINVIED